MEHEFLKPYVCTQCGGRVNRSTLTCEMCGTHFKDVSTPEFVRIVVDKPGVHVLKSTMAMDKYMANELGAIELSRIVIERMSQSLAEAIAPYIDLEWEDSPRDCSIHVMGRIRVLDPKERFW